MFLHIGADCSVPVKDITMILDCENEIIKSSLHALKSSDAGDTRRSAVLTPEKVYYSPIATSTLRKRLQKVIQLTKVEYVHNLRSNT